MQIETYEIEEINSSEASTMAADSAAIELINSLGLEGQKSLVNGKAETRQPYRQMSALELNVYTVLFPQKTDIREFRSSPMPLRVLQVIAHAQACGLFSRIEVWHPIDQRMKDPVLVGWAKDTRSGWEWNSTAYILARWGDALESLEDLAVKAQKIWATRTKAALTGLKMKVDCDIARVDSIAAIGFSGGELETLSYSLHA